MIGLGILLFLNPQATIIISLIFFIYFNFTKIHSSAATNASIKVKESYYKI